MEGFLFNPFIANTEEISLPEKFTFPFNYEPHPLSIFAAEELQEHLINQNWDHNFGFEKDGEGKVMGKMFGVLVVQNQNKQLGYLAAFSGKLANENHHQNFVPPIYDRLTQEGFFLKGEEELNAINSKIEQLEQSSDYTEAKQKLDNATEKSVLELQQLKIEIKEAKETRKQRRFEAEKTLSPTELIQFNDNLNKESQDQQRHYKRTAKQWKINLEFLQQQVNQLKLKIAALKERRKNQSAQLQQQLFEQYQFLNYEGDIKSVLSIFENTTLKVPPAGAGDCAAPKLLQYAFQHNLKPICMAEFWWGVSPKQEIRKHKHFYPACKSKCEPILNHMLKGLTVDPNPIKQKNFEKKVIEAIYEDEHILIINKPHDLLSVSGKSEQDSVATRLKLKYPNASGPLLVHRLDMSTSGLLLVAKSEEHYKLLQRQFIQHTIEKRYVALLDGVVQENDGTIDLPLRVDLDNRPHQLVCFDHGKAARTHWKVVQRTNSETRILFFPVTGRTHQLRVHAAHPSGLNTPIKGDDLYGITSERLYLHAEAISFNHPVTNKRLSFTAPAPF